MSALMRMKLPVLGISRSLSRLPTMETFLAVVGGEEETTSRHTRRPNMMTGEIRLGLSRETGPHNVTLTP